MKITIEIIDQDYQYCLDYVGDKTNTMALNNINRIIKAVADGTPEQMSFHPICKDCISKMDEIRRAYDNYLRFIDKDKLLSNCEYMSFDIDKFNKSVKVIALDTVKNIVKDITPQELRGDAINREAVLELQYRIDDSATLSTRDVVNVEDIQALPPVTPQEPKCKDCKWWKDSDGAYRRGCGAESRCPINRKEVYEGNGYCFLYEPQESEGKNE